MSIRVLPLMSTLLVVMLGAIMSMPAKAQAAGASTPIYLPTGRYNDPFVFCTEGMPLHGWIAVSPIQGTWTPISQYVNYQWIPTYMIVCPRGMRLGWWTGPGPANMVPFYH